MMNQKNKKLDQFTTHNIHFLAEQIGVSENEFKEELVRLINSQQMSVRIYLVRVEYDKKNDFNIAVCIFMEGHEDENLAKDIASIFRRFFGSHEHLDILFLNDRQETELRKVCCPFYSSKGYRYKKPDFFLTSSEGYNLEKVRACYKRTRLLGNHFDGYMLCDIDPPMVGQPYGLGEKDIHEIIIASRHQGHSIFSINKWPAYVHVALLKNDAVRNNKFIITEDDTDHIGWAEIYDSLESAKKESH
jgi:hypothetical protein